MTEATKTDAQASSADTLPEETATAVETAPESAAAEPETADSSAAVSAEEIPQGPRETEPAAEAEAQDTEVEDEVETASVAAASQGEPGTSEIEDPAGPDSASETADDDSGGDDEPVLEKPAPPLLEPLIAAHEEGAPIEGKVIGWNQGGFHVALGEVPAFCPRSEMEVTRPKAPKTYLDNSYRFLILRIEEEGRRIVLSRAAVQRQERAEKRKKARSKVAPGAVLKGRVASLTDFGAFVDLGGVQGLVHVSEISRERVNKPADVLSMGQTVEVKVLKVENGGRRISLSMKALEPDPWRESADQFAAGSVVNGKVEKVAPFGVFIELQPGITGLLPGSTVKLPMGTSLARRFPVGKEVTVQIMSVDPRRRRISLSLEGSGLEGSRTDYEQYKKQAQSEAQGGFNALAAALKKARDS
ncbi:MAG: S1 RNA-binding domain-containing protein [Thermoanaerobaculia bacterium]|nr:S1 RNA-binding domain-containing protein [Thermoanaerobaculia bacterium]